MTVWDPADMVVAANPSTALNAHTRAAFDALVAALEKRLADTAKPKGHKAKAADAVS